MGGYILGMINAELSRVFDRIADLLEIDGADGFRVNSYRRAARTLKDAAQDVAELAREGKLTDLPGVGKGTAERIEQYLTSGRIDLLDELEGKFPKGLPSLLEIPGLGPKKVALVYNELKVKSVEDLKKVIESGAMEKLPGLGAASVKKIAEGLAFLEKSGGRTPMGVALPVAELFVGLVRAFPGVNRAEFTGSLRRGAETIGDIDLLCDAADGEATVKRFTSLPHVQRVLASGATKGSITVALNEQREVQIDLRVVPSESYGAALQYFTGSREHNVRIRERAMAKKWKLNEYGLYDGDKMLAGKKEEDIYKKLGLPWVPPELREDRGELELSETPELVTLDDIHGDLHMHTTASDGKCSIAEMAAAAKALGYDYIAICDHSKSSTIANGLSIERMEQHIKTIRATAKKMKGIEILVGCECDILPDGSMDYPDDLLAQCDWVVASIHSAQGSTKHTPTERTLAAIENKYVSAIGHPTGRLINRRAAMDLDIAKIAAAAAKNNTMLEINASWQRLDLKDVHARIAIDAGVTLVIDTDAHHTEQLLQMRLGVVTARRAGALRKNIANCGTLAGLRKLIDRKRES